MSSLNITKLLMLMKRKGEGEVLSIKSLNAQINAMMQVVWLIEDEDSRFHFMKRIEAVQRDLRHLHSELESKLPQNLKRPSNLNFDHALRLIGSSEEDYISIRQNVQDITQKIDRLSEGLAFVVQRDRDNRRFQAFRSQEDPHLHSESGFPCDDSDLYVQDNIQPTTYYYSRDTDDLGTGSDYFFEYSQLNPDGNQVQISFSHARRYHQPSSSSQAGQHNQPKFHTRGPNYLYPPYFTEYPSDRLGYFPSGHHPGTSSQTSNVPRPPAAGPSFWRIIPSISNLSIFGNHDGSSSKYPVEEFSFRGYSRHSQKSGARHTARYS